MFLIRMAYRTIGWYLLHCCNSLELARLFAETENKARILFSQGWLWETGPAPAYGK